MMGLRYQREQVAHLLKGIQNMKDSVTYQAIVEEGKEIGKELGKKIGKEAGVKIGEKMGRAEEARAILIRLATMRLGKPTDRVLSKLNKIDDTTRLEDLIMRTLIAKSWTDLLK